MKNIYEIIKNNVFEYIVSIYKQNLNEFDISITKKNKDLNKRGDFCIHIRNNSYKISLDTEEKNQKYISGCIFNTPELYSIFLKRETVIKDVLTASISNRLVNIDSKNILVTLNNSVFFKNVEINNLNDLRSIVVLYHSQQLLIINGFQTQLVDYPLNESITSFLKENLNIDTPQQSTVCEECYDCNKWMKAEIIHLKESSPYIKINNVHEELEIEVQLDLRKFLSDSKDSISKNYNSNILEVSLYPGCPNLAEIYYLKKNLKKNSKNLVIHITKSSSYFHQQIIDLTFQNLINSRGETCKQIHLVCSKVNGRESTEIISIEEFLKLKKYQIKEAFESKYGNKKEQMDELICDLTKACIIFELLSTKLPHELKINLSSNINTDQKGGIFVFYNCARLFSILQKFESLVENETYPSLPDSKAIDFSLLKLEDEWELIFNYILMFPIMVKETITYDKKGEILTIENHKVCQFLSSLSYSFSNYYSKTHILVGPIKHLMPTMHARIYLIKVLQSIFKEALCLLHIKPFKYL